MVCLVTKRRDGKTRSDKQKLQHETPEGAFFLAFYLQAEGTRRRSGHQEHTEDAHKARTMPRTTTSLCNQGAT